MNVSDIIALLGSLSIGLDDPSDSDIAVYLKYLNIAYTEILQETIAQSSQVRIVTDTLIPFSNGEILEGQFSQTPFVFKMVYDVTSNTPLSRTTLDAVQSRDPGFQRSGTPREWYSSSGSLWVYPSLGNSFTGISGISFTYISGNAFTINTSSDLSGSFFVNQNLQLVVNGTTYALQVVSMDTSIPNQITFTVTGDTIPVFSSLDSVSLNAASFSNIGITYIPQPALLDINTTSGEISMPTLYQYILADGAAYYVFQSETGFKDQSKMMECKARWEKGKRDLFSYYKNFGGKQFFSTYSAV